MLETYRKWLVGIWGIGFLVPVILIVFQAVNGKYGEKFPETLGWLTSLTLPTILIMIGVIIGNPTVPAVDSNSDDELSEEERAAKEKEAKLKAAHETFVFRIAVSVSAVYLLIINLVFFLEPFAESRPQKLMGDSKIILAVFDSIISLLIGYFFGRK